MKDKIISIDSMKNISIDKILELYKDGYRLDESPIMILQCPSGCYNTTNVVFAFITGIITGYSAYYIAHKK